jgi:hypothetical protein
MPLLCAPRSPATERAFHARRARRDLAKIRDALVAVNFLSPVLNDARVVRDAETNRVNIELTGAVGPKVDVKITNYELSEKAQHDLLPVKREGNIDYSAIIEGERRMRNKLQEDGFFFARSLKSVASPIRRRTWDQRHQETCENLNPTTSAATTSRSSTSRTRPPLSSCRHPHHRHEQADVRDVAGL